MGFLHERAPVQGDWWYYSNYYLSIENVKVNRIWIDDTKATHASDRCVQVSML